MFYHGQLTDRNGTSFELYMAVSDKFERIDICRIGARYQTDIDAVIYSRYRQATKVYEKGDNDLYDIYVAVRNAVELESLDEKDEFKYENGEPTQLITRNSRANSNRKLYSKKKVVAGKMTFYEANTDKGQYYLTLVDSGSMFLQLPIDKSSYELQGIEKRGKQNKEVQTGLYRSEEQLFKMYDIEHLKEMDLNVITDIDEARAYLHRMKHNNEEIIIVDTETSGLDVNLYGKDRMCGVVMSISENEGTYFPFRHVAPSNNLPLSFLPEMIEKINTCGKDVASHNIKFDIKVFMKENLYIHYTMDSIIASFMIDPVIMRGRHSLKEKVESIVGKTYLELDKIFYNKADIDHSVLDLAVSKWYACPDGPNTRVVLKWCLSQMKFSVQKKMFLEQCKANEVKAINEFYGFRIDMDNFKLASDNNAKTLERIEEAIHLRTNQKDLKISSATKLRELLYTKLKCPVYVTTNTGLAATTNKALKKLKEAKLKEPRGEFTEDFKDEFGKVVIEAKVLDNAKYDIVHWITAFRAYHKLKTSYYDKVNKSIDAAGGGCPRVFFWINLNGTATDRQSSPAHTYPKEIKGKIIADSSHHNLIDADYSQVELRILAAQAKEIKLIELCNIPGMDIHRAVDHLIRGVPIWSITEEDRGKAKGTNFGVVYQMQGKGLADSVFGLGATKEQIKLADEMILGFYRVFKNIYKYTRELKDEILATGIAWGNLGMFRDLTAIKSKDITKRYKASLLRQGVNAPTQGTAAGIMKIAEAAINEYIKEMGWDKLVDTPEGRYPMVRLMISVHDEVLLSSHKDIPIEEIILMLRECMELEIPGFPKLFAAASVIENWEESKDSKYEIPSDFRDILLEEYRRTGKTKFKDYKTLKKDMAKAIEVYKEGRLQEYLEPILAKYGEEEMYKYITDDVLTHEFISRFAVPKEEKGKYKGATQYEFLKYAVKEYMKFREGYVPPVVEEVYEPMNYEGFLDEMTGIYEMDDKGNYIIDDDEDFEGEDIVLDWGIPDDYVPLENYIPEEFKDIYTFKLFDQYIFNMEDLENNECNQILAELNKEVSAEGHYTLVIQRGGKLVETPWKLGEIDYLTYSDKIDAIKKARKGVS